MKKTIIFILIGSLFIAVMLWIIKANKKEPNVFNIEKPFISSIVEKAVATGKVTPLEEIDIKPQISGIVDRIYVEEGQKVKKGTLIAKIKVVPNVQALNSATGRVKNAQIQYENAELIFDRNRKLFEQGAISAIEFENSKLQLNSSQQELLNSKSDLEIVKEGSFEGMGTSTKVRATIAGTVLEIPVKEGYQLIESNSFNAGTTIATIADMSKMIFEGKVDESEVNKIQKDTEIEVSIGAIQDKKFPAKLKFIAPKGTDESGAVQFKIKADLALDKDYYIRAGYSANADIMLARKDSILVIREALLQFDDKTDEPYVEIKVEDDKFEKKEIKIGISDGINVEIFSGLKKSDQIKVWNKATKGNNEKDKK